MVTCNWFTLFECEGNAQRWDIFTKILCFVINKRTIALENKMDDGYMHKETIKNMLDVINKC